MGAIRGKIRGVKDPIRAVDANKKGRCHTPVPYLCRTVVMVQRDRALRDAMRRTFHSQNSDRLCRKTVGIVSRSYSP